MSEGAALLGRDPIIMEKGRAVLRTRRHVRFDQPDDFGIVTPDKMIYATVSKGYRPGGAGDGRDVQQPPRSTDERVAIVDPAHDDRRQHLQAAQQPRRLVPSSVRRLHGLFA